MSKNLTGNKFIIPIIIILLILPVFIKSAYWMSVLVLSLINVLTTSSLRTIKILGYISMGHIGFSLIGAYTSALFVMKLGIPFWMAIVIAGLIAGVIALLLGYPFLKVRGIYFAILTLLTAETFRILAMQLKGITGGSWGLLGIPSPEPIYLPFLNSISFDNVHNYYYLALIVILMCLFILYRFENSRIGFIWRAIRDADDLAHSVGINIMKYKIINFCVASFFAGIAGALFAHFQHSLSPAATARFSVSVSIYLIFYMAIGGERSFWGPIIGAMLFTVLVDIARPLGEFQPLFFGLVAILITIFMPEGLVSLPERVKNYYLYLTRKRINGESTLN